MARYPYQSFIQDGNGRAVEGVTVTVYEADTTTLATIYAAKTGGSAIASGQITTNASGYFIFYIDSPTYPAVTFFDIVPTKSGYQFETIQDIPIYGIGVDDDYYYPDYGVTDQGATDPLLSIKDCVDAIGSTIKGTIYLRHNSTGTFTDYDFATGETIPANITVMREAGARIVPTNCTIAILGSFESDLSQAFSLIGTGKVIGLLDSYPEWFGAITGGSTDCSPAIGAADISVASILGGSYRAGTVHYKSGAYLWKSTITKQPFTNWKGVRGATANSTVAYTTLTDSHGTIFRAHTDIYDNDNNSAGVMLYLETGDGFIENITMVGTATFSANPSVGIQFGYSDGARTHEGADQNLSGININNTSMFGFATAWEIYNINDSYGFNNRFESNTTGLLLLGRADGSYVGTLELHGAIIYASSYGIVIGANINMELVFIGGLFEGSAVTTEYHIHTATTMPQTVAGYSPSFRFVGTRFRHSDAANVHINLTPTWAGWEGFFQFDGCPFEGGSTAGINITDAVASGVVNQIRFNNCNYKDTAIILTDITDCRFLGGAVDNTAFTVTGTSYTAPFIKDLYGISEVMSLCAGTSLETRGVGNLFTVTNAGGTTLATIYPSYTGQIITLKFTDSNTTVAGASIKLSAAFTGTANDILELMFDGTNWVEKTRSVNA